jgi:hypothetical protein
VCGVLAAKSLAVVKRGDFVCCVFFFCSIRHTFVYGVDMFINAKGSLLENELGEPSFSRRQLVLIANRFRPSRPHNNKPHRSGSNSSYHILVDILFHPL